MRIPTIVLNVTIPIMFVILVLALFLSILQLDTLKNEDGPTVPTVSTTTPSSINIIPELSSFTNGTVQYSTIHVQERDILVIICQKGITAVELTPRENNEHGL